MDHEILAGIKKTLQEIADILYKGNVQDGFAMMSQVLPDISLIMSGISDAKVQERLIEDALAPALEAMEEKDGVWLADVITYELFDILNEL